MKATEVLKKAKELLSIDTEEVTLATATLENGTTIEAESFKSGEEVFIVTEDEKVALPVGEYQLDSGDVLLVKEEGIIESIGAKAEEEKPNEEDLSEETELEEDEKKMKEHYATKEELAEVKKLIEDVKEMVKGMDKKEEMSSEVEENLSEAKEEENKKEELSTVPKVKHNPEKENERKLHLYGQGRALSTYDRVLKKISNINN